MKLMKNTVILIFILSALFLLVAWFANGGFGTNTNKLSEYREFKNYDGESSLKIFPSSLPDYFVEADYIYSYREGIFGPSCQIYFEVKYEEKYYKLELNRLQKITTVYDTSNYIYPALVIPRQVEGVFEYVLYDDANQTIYYIYLEQMPKRSIKFDKELLNFEYDESWVSN